MAKEPIVSTLFRFVTTRNPQLLTKEERLRGFIYFPKQSRSSSHFLNELNEDDTADDRRQHLDSRVSAFSPMTKRSQVENVKIDLYEFSHWLMKHKDTLTISDVESRMITTTPVTLSNAELISLWDQLHYQVLTKRSNAVREAIIRMIVADYFLKKDDSRSNDADKLINTDVELQRLANAYVCLLYTSPSPRDLSTSRMPSSA